MSVGRPGGHLVRKIVSKARRTLCGPDAVSSLCHGFSFAAAVVPASAGQESSPPPSAAAIEITAPADAKLTVNGRICTTSTVVQIGGGRQQNRISVVKACCNDGSAMTERVHIAPGSHFAVAFPAPADQRQLEVQSGPACMVRFVAFGPDGRFAAAATNYGRAVLWDTLTGDKVRTFGENVVAIALSKDGRRLLTGSSDGKSILWNIRTGEPAQKFAGDAGLACVAIRPDGKYVLTGSWDNTATLWDVRTAKRARVFAGHTGAVTSVAFAADGREAVTGSVDATAILWDVATGEKLRVFNGHEGTINAVAVRPNGQQLLTGSNDGAAVLWDETTGRRVQLFERRTNASRRSGERVESAAFSPDGQQVAICFSGLASGFATGPTNVAGLTEQSAKEITAVSEIEVWDIVKGKKGSRLRGTGGISRIGRVQSRRSAAASSKLGQTACSGPMEHFDGRGGPRIRPSDVRGLGGGQRVGL